MSIKEISVDQRKADKACQIAEEFVKIYYQQLDSGRHTLIKMYSDNALLVWNGNGITGNDKIQKFLMELPTTRHRMKTLDAQHISDAVVNIDNTCMVQACGEVSFLNKDDRRPFQQSFVIVPMEGKWKIMTDCYTVQLDKDGFKS